MERGRWWIRGLKIECKLMRAENSLSKLYIINTANWFCAKTREIKNYRNVAVDD